MAIDGAVSLPSGARRLAAIMLSWLLLAACTQSAPDSGRSLSPSSLAAPVARDYWPTAGWRHAAPSDHGIDAAELAQVEDQLAKGYPHVRSVLVVRAGYLVYERYRAGLDVKSGHDVRSVTKPGSTDDLGGLSVP